MLASALACLVLGAFAFAVWTDGSVPALEAIALFVMASIAVHREAVFADETAVSGSVLVICAGIIGFGESSLLVPLLCAVGAALHQEHIRQGQFLKLVVNLGATVVPAFLATLVFRGVWDAGSPASKVLALLGSVSAYWLLNNALVGVAIASARRQRPQSFMWELIRSDTVMLVFAVGGALCGVVMNEVGPWVGILALAALLVALDVFVISVPAGPAALRAAWKMVVTRVLAGFTAGIVAMVVAAGFSTPVAGATVGIVAGLAAGFVVVLAVAATRLLGHGHRLDTVLMGGFVVAELPLPGIGAIAGAFGALEGAAAAFVVASGLIIVASLLAACRRRGNPKQFDDDVITAAVTQAMLDGLPDPDRRR